MKKKKKTRHQLSPRGEYVLCEVAEVETKTTSGVMLPTSAQRVPTSGDVVALGDGVGAFGSSGEWSTVRRDFELKPGDTVLYSKFGLGCTDLTLGGKPHILLRESDVIGTMPRSGATAADVPQLRPLGDRVLLKVQPAADVTAGGVVLPDSAKEKPIVGEVVAVGPGKRAGDRGGPRGVDRGAGGSDTAAPAPAAAPPSAAAVALDAFAALEARLAKQEAEEKKNKKAATEIAL